MILTPYPKIQFLDDFGNPLSGGKVYTYTIGTTTPLATFQDKDGLIANTNPIILDSAGRALIWLGTADYTFVIHNSSDVLQGSGGDIVVEDYSLKADITALDLKADIASPTLTGIPAAPTAAAGTDTTQLATTAFVKANSPPNPNKLVTGVYVTEGVDGGGIASHTNTTITMRPYSCIADDGTTQLYKSTSTIVDLGTPAINTDYHLFMVKLTDGTFSYMSDTDIDGAGLTGILAKRWDAYVPVDSAGAIQLLWMHGDEIFFSNQVTMYVTTSLTTSFVEYSLSAILPIARIDSVALKSLTITASWAIAFDASNRQLDFAAPSAGQVTREAYLPIANSVWLRASSSASITVSSIKLKR